MKLVVSNGRELTVRDVGPVIFRVTAGKIPIKCAGGIMDEESCRALLKKILSTELYQWERFDGR